MGKVQKFTLYAAVCLFGLGLTFSPGVEASSDGGEVEIEGNNVEVKISDLDLGNSDVSPFATKKVGGGEWKYGSHPHLVLGIEGLRKKAYSNYYHKTYLHTSTATIGNNKKQDRAAKGYWSRANAYGAINQTAYAKWNIP